MQLINNRYRIIDIIEETSFINSYKVIDILDNYNTIYINVLNINNIPKRIIDYLNDEFIKLKSVNNPNIINISHYSLIKYIDKEFIKEPMYFYSTEFFENGYELIKIIDTLSNDQRLEIFSNICTSLNTMHLKGIPYNGVQIENLYYDSKNSQVKLKDLLTVYLENFQLQDLSLSGFLNNHIEPDKNKDNVSDKINKDIYDLGILLMKMFDLCDYQANNKIDGKNNSLFILNIIKIIEKLIGKSNENKYENIGDVIRDINTLFNKTFSFFNLEVIEKVNLKIKLIGREYFKFEILNTYANMLKTESAINLIGIHGDTGIGKTRFLREIKHLLFMSKAKVFYDLDYENSDINNTRLPLFILKNIISQCDEEMLLKYDKESKYLNNISQLENYSLDFFKIMNTKQKFILINRLVSFIKDFAKDTPIVLIIDNLENMHPFILELFEYLFFENIKNLLLIFSYTDTTSSLDKLNLFLSKIRNSGNNYIDYKFSPLSENETSEMVKELINIPSSNVNFTTKIYHATFGNPLFISEIIKKLFFHNEIYVNKENGEWSINNINDIQIPHNIEQAMADQLKYLDEYSKELLNLLSFFKDGTSIEFLSILTNNQLDVIEKYINSLTEKGIIVKKVNDKNFVFDFNSKILKKLIYNNLNEDTRKYKHETISKVLEESNYEFDTQYNDELIYHLEKAAAYDRLVKYYIENAERYESHLIGISISYFEKALTILNKNIKDTRFYKILYKLGSLYIKDGNIKTALCCFHRAIAVSSLLNDEIYQVEIFCKIASTYLDMHEINLCVDYLSKAEIIVNKFNYLDGRFEVNLMWIKIYNMRFDFEKSLEICNNSILLSDKHSILYKGKFLKLKGNVLYSKGNIYEALEALKDSITCFESIECILKLKNDQSIITLPLNNMAKIYCFYFQDYEKALECCTKMRTVTDISGTSKSQSISIVTTGTAYFYAAEYKEAEEWLLKGYEKAKKIHNFYPSFPSMLYLCYIYLKEQHYEEAYKFYELLNKSLQEFPEECRRYNEYFRISASMFYEFGAIEKAKALVKFSLRNESKVKPIFQLHGEILNQFILLRLTDEDFEIENIFRHIMQIIYEFKSNKVRANIIKDLTFELELKNKLDLISELLYDLNFENKDENIEVIILYIKGICSKSEEKLAYLKKALNIAINIKDKNLQWRLYRNIGNHYLENDTIFFAMNFYLDACEIIKNLTMSVPEKYKFSYVQSNNMLEPFNKLIKLNYSFNKIDSSKPVEFADINSLNKLYEVFEYLHSKNILVNNNFIKSSQKVYDDLYDNKVKNYKDILTNISPNPIDNLKNIIKYLARVTLSKSIFIFSEEENGIYKPLASISSDKYNSNTKYIMDKVHASKKPILVTNNTPLLDSNLNIDLFKNKSIICIPIIMQTKFKDRKGVSINDTDSSIASINHNAKISGYLYLESDTILNNFNDNSFKICETLCPLIGFIIENQHLIVNSSIDKLTGTYMRKYMEEVIFPQIKENTPAEGSFSLLMLDIDDFKLINDKFGHQTGDYVLKKLCNIILKKLSSSYYCSRYGGEEFTILLPNTSINQAEIITENLRKCIQESKILSTKRDVTVSIGLSNYPSHGTTLQELIEKADKALYVAKENGKNTYQVWQDEFLGKVKVTDKLTGILCGNAVQDHRNVSVIVELLDLIKEDVSLEQKIYNFLGRIIEIIEAKQGILFLLSEDEIVAKYERFRFKDNFAFEYNCNDNLVKDVIAKKQGIYLIDWDSISDVDSISKMPDWKSVILIPIINSCKLKAILYLSVSTREKEFKFEDFNFVSTLGDILAGILN